MWEMDTDARPHLQSTPSQKVLREPRESNDPREFDIVSTYYAYLHANPSMTMPVAAIEALVELLSQSEAKTVSEFMDLLQRGTLALKQSVKNYISLSAGCDLFQRWVVRTLQDASDFEACKRYFYTHGKMFVRRAQEARESIAVLGTSFIQDDYTVFVHSYSRVVTALLFHAAAQHVRFKVVVTESRPDAAGATTAKLLRERGIPVAVILDATIGFAMQKCDLVLVGAQGVLEDGGIVSKIGTFPVAVLAKTAHKPFYVVAESHKFVRLFPLTQYDLPTSTEMEFFADAQPASPSASLPPTPNGLPHRNKSVSMLQQDIDNNPEVDYTGPAWITGLITDIGVLTPSGVSEELIKLWQ